MLFKHLALLSIPVALFVACGDTGDEIKDEVTGTVDCAQICQRYDSCVEDVDESTCIDQCEDTADSSESGADRASNCENCLDGKSCEDATSCWVDCPVVAESE